MLDINTMAVCLHLLQIYHLHVAASHMRSLASSSPELDICGVLWERSEYVLQASQGMEVRSAVRWTKVFVAAE